MKSKSSKIQGIFLCLFMFIFLVTFLFEVVDADEIHNKISSSIGKRELKRQKLSKVSVANPSQQQQHHPEDGEEDDDVNEQISSPSLVTTTTTTTTLTSVTNDKDKLEIDSNQADYEEEMFDNSNSSNIIVAMICIFGACFSLYTLLVEHLKWDPKSFQRFSVTTKIPVEIFCISGPLVLVTTVIYSIMAGLLLIENNTTSVFFISTSWTAIMIDMSFVCYTHVISDILANRIDTVLHIVNLVTILHSYQHLRFFPSTFIFFGLTFWGVVVLIRVMRRLRNGEQLNTIFRPGSP